MRIFPAIRNTRLTLHTKYPQYPLPSSSSHLKTPITVGQNLQLPGPIVMFLLRWNCHNKTKWIAVSVRNGREGGKREREAGDRPGIGAG